MLWCPEALWWYPATLSKGVCRRQEKVTQLWWKVHSFLCTQPGWTILPKKVKMKKVDRRVIYFKDYRMETLRQPPRIWKGFNAWFWKCLLWWEWWRYQAACGPFQVAWQRVMDLARLACNSFLPACNVAVLWSGGAETYDVDILCSVLIFVWYGSVLKFCIHFDLPPP